MVEGRACRTWLMAACLAALPWLSACSRSSDETGTTSAATGTTARPVNAAPPADPDMVSAVSTAKSATPIDLKFRLAGKPVVGQSAALELLLLPDAAARVVRIQLSLQGGEGLQIEGPTSLSFEQIEPAMRTELRIKPLQEGVWTLAVTALVDTETSSVARTYSIPVIAGI